VVLVVALGLLLGQELGPVRLEIPQINHRQVETAHRLYRTKEIMVEVELTAPVKERQVAVEGERLRLVETLHHQMPQLLLAVMVEMDRHLLYLAHL